MSNVEILELPHESLRKLTAWEQVLDEQVTRLECRQIEIRRHLHRYPEPSREEVETTRYVADCLTSVGLEARIGRDGLGVTADCQLGRCAADSPLIAIRADLDALRIQDIKQTSYASQHPGVCHACGHDAHTAIVLGAALCCAGLNEVCDGSDDAPAARLRFIFQPAEESAEGARWMVEQGAVDDVDAILAVHVDPERELGTVGIRYGTLTANCDEIGIVVEGKGGHSARPHHTRDPIAAAAHLITSLYEFLPRSVDSRNPSVFSVGRVAGGSLPNVIPERVEILGSLRTTDASTRQTLKNRIEEIVHGAKETSGASIHLHFSESIDAVCNDPLVTTALEESSRRVLGSENIHYIDHASMGGEDFSGYLARVPGAMIRLGCAPPGFTAPFLHAPDFDIDERTLAVGTRIMLRAALLLAAGPAPRIATG